MKPKKKNNITSSKVVEIAKSSDSTDDVLISVLQKLPVAVVIFSETNILFLNKEALQIFKLSKALEKSITNHSIFDFLLPEYHQLVKENTVKVFQGQEFIPFETKIRNAKNKIIDLEVKSNAIVFNGKKAIQSIFTDISEQVIYRQELSDAKENLELITQNANDLIFFYTYHPKPKYIYISPAIKKILGYSPKDFYENGNLGNSIVLDKKGYKAFEAIISKKQKNNTLQHTSASFQYKTKSGKLVWLEDNYSPIYNDKGKIKFILGISRDISNEKNAQLELEQKWDNYKNLLDSAPIGIVIHDGTCIYSNKTAANILEEKNPLKLIGLDLFNFFLPAEKSIAIDRIKRVLDGEELVNKVYKIKTLKGNIIDVELKTVPFIYNGKSCVQTIITNISAEKKLEKESLRAEIAEETNKKLLAEINYRKLIQNELVTQTTKYEAIFNNTSHLIWTVNRELKITSFNQNYYNYIKTIFNHELKIGQHISDVVKLLNNNLVSFWSNKYTNFFNNKNNTVEYFEINNTNYKGKIYYREIFLHPIRSNDGSINEIAVISHDSTERRLSEQKIVEQSAKLKAIFESGDHLIWTVNKKFELTSYNKNYFNLIENNVQKKRLIENKIISVFDTIQKKENKDFWLSKYELVLKGEHHVFVHKSMVNNTDVYREVYLYPIFLNNELVEISVIAQNITERINNQNKIIEQSSKLKAIFESGEQLMWTITKDYKFTSLNKNYANAIFDLYGFYPEIGKSIREIGKNKTLKFQPLWNEKYKSAFSGKQVELTTERIKTNGTKVFRQYYLYPIKNVNNEVIEVSGIGFDITENKINEEKINQSLKEKEILLKEVHHRVKNNMQVISSILNLQSSYVNDVYALNLLKECQNRIKSMAFIHESLYQSKNFESVNFSDYISTLAKNLVHTYSVNTQKIKLILTLDKLFLNLDTSIPCGLIINEIISNSLKYAFPNNRDGIIFVTLKVNDNKALIQAGDNGIGISPKIDLKQSKTLGLHLVDTLVEQINGTIQLDRIKGTKFNIEFKL